MRKKKEPVAVGSLLAEIELPKLTDEQWAAHDAQVAQERARFASQEAHDRWKFAKAEALRAGLSERHLEAIYYGQLEETLALKAVRSIERGAGIYALSGSVGCGKTLAAQCWLLGYWSDWRRWTLRGIALVTAAWFARSSRYDRDNKFTRVEKPRRLVLDDLGVEHADAGGQYRIDLDELVDLRWRAKRPTVITTNLNSKAFADRYGRRIVDRLRDEGGWFDVKQSSMRKG